ncbi:MAG: YidC/Oxa1 family membrane protein insertase [Lachnospiraceae bacterium]|nr:YidC/Oxa1 family membrane protein insertase [Lachnospiraceae bacterium]
MIVATKSGVPILGQVSTLLGWLMDGIYRVLDMIGIQNVGLSIIIFTLIIYMILTPIQIKQQKLSKMTAIMNPELQAIQKKYKNKKDQASMMKMQEETTLVYQKYGVSPMGTCLPLLIQMPILLALYQVIYRIPAYVGSVRAIFTDAVTKITSVNGYTDIIQNFLTDNKINTVQLTLENGVATNNSIIDVLYKLSPSQWEAFAEIDKFSSFSNVINDTASEIAHVQSFLGLNIADTPFAIVKTAIAAGSILLAIGAILIPFLAWFTQWLNYKLMPQATSSNNSDATNSMEATMKTMNTTMPLMSAFFCLTLPVGMGIYWIAGAVIRSVQMLVINRHMANLDLDKLIKKNMEKAQKKRAKEGLPPQKITNQAHQNARKINTANIQVEQKDSGSAPKDYKPGSLASKANLVKQFEEKNKKK